MDSKKGLIELNHFLKSISHRQNVFAVAGNHDYSLGVCQIQEMMIRNNVVWLEDKTINVNIENSIVKIDGNFITDRAGNTDFSILLLHKPKHIHTFYENYNLALAGHLHGSQVVFWESNDELFPGRLFYRWNILKKKKDKCYYFISKGLGDTLPIRYNCKRDLLFIQVTNNN